MRKYIIPLSIIIIVLIGVMYMISEKLREKGRSALYSCDMSAYPPDGRVSFYIEIQEDKQYHMRMATKPPQTDTVVTKTQLAPFSFRYVGGSVDIKDSTNSLQVIFNGNELKNCRKDEIF